MNLQNVKEEGVSVIEATREMELEAVQVCTRVTTVIFFILFSHLIPISNINGNYSSYLNQEINLQYDYFASQTEMFIYFEPIPHSVLFRSH